MAKKKDRAFFLCPRWNEIVAGQDAASIRVDAKTLAALRQGHALARSTLRKALVAVCRASGMMIDVDAYIVDRRTGHP